MFFFANIYLNIVTRVVICYSHMCLMYIICSHSLGVLSVYKDISGYHGLISAWLFILTDFFTFTFIVFLLKLSSDNHNKTNVSRYRLAMVSQNGCPVLSTGFAYIVRQDVYCRTRTG